MLADGSCSKQKSVTYNLKQRDVDITSEGLISVQVQTGFKNGQNIHTIHLVGVNELACCFIWNIEFNEFNCLPSRTNNC